MQTQFSQFVKATTKLCIPALLELNLMLPVLMRCIFDDVFLHLKCIKCAVFYKLAMRYLCAGHYVTSVYAPFSFVIALCISNRVAFCSGIGWFLIGSWGDYSTEVDQASNWAWSPNAQAHKPKTNQRQNWASSPQAQALLSKALAQSPNAKPSSS